MGKELGVDFKFIKWSYSMCSRIITQKDPLTFATAVNSSILAKYQSNMNSSLITMQRDVSYFY